MHWIYLIHEFHNLSWITEINELFHDILIYWDAPVNSLLQTYVPSRILHSASERCIIVPSQRGTKSLSQTFTLTVPSWWNDLPNSIQAAESFSHLQESGKNTSLPSLFDPLTLAISILILFLKKEDKLPLLDLDSIHLLTACFLKKTKKN